MGTGAVSQVPPIEGVSGDDALGWDDGVHLLHSMGDTFAIMRTLEDARPSSAVIVGAGYIGLEMAEGLTARGLKVTQMERLDEVLPTVDPELALSSTGSCQTMAWRYSPARPCTRSAAIHEG